MFALDSIVELVAATVFVVAQALGHQLGMAIVVVSLACRLMILPLSLKWAQSSARHRQVMEKIRPELQSIQKRLADRPQKLTKAMGELFNRHQVAPVDTAGLKSAMLQAPIVLVLWSAIRQVAQSGGRFLWIGDLARPDLLLAVLGATLTGLGASMAGAGSEQVAKIMMWMPIAFSLFFLLKASAGVGLYWVCSNAVGVAQSHYIRRRYSS